MQNDNVKQHLWGVEITWANKEDYKGKILVFEKQGYSTDMHMHTQSSKSWFINSGTVKVNFVDTKDGQTYEKVLNEGDTFDVDCCTPVMLISNTDGASVSEVSNQSTDDLIILAKTMALEEKKKNVEELV